MRGIRTPDRRILTHLHTKLSLFLIVSVSASLPCPEGVRMIPLDMNYTLQWDWTFTELRNSTTFTAEYAFSNEEDNETSYKRVCEGSEQRRCDFTDHLDFSCSYVLRVRAESGGRQSAWACVQFTPDEDGMLGPPSQVSVDSDVAMLILTIFKSVKSTEVKLQYRVLYWERQNPAQQQVKYYDDPYVSLVSLKPWVEYCVQVSVFDQRFDMSSNYTSPQCAYTKGHSSLWQVLSAVLFSILTAGALGYIFYVKKLRSQFAAHKTPDSILGLPLLISSTLEVQEGPCVVAFVTTPTIQLQFMQCPLQEQDDNGGIQAGSTHSGNSSFGHDSGFGSAQES